MRRGSGFVALRATPRRARRGPATDINARSIGIELVNPGHEFGYRPFPEAQMASLVVLAREILQRHPIPAARVLGHSDVAPARKQDPGELFDWQGHFHTEALADGNAGRAVPEIVARLKALVHALSDGSEP